MRRQEFVCQDMIYSTKLAAFVWLKVQLNSDGSMSPHRMAWQTADPQSPAHRRKPSCCSWHRQVSSTAWSLGRLLPTFVMHKGNAWAYHKQGKPESAVHAQQAKYNSLCKNWNIEQKPSGWDRRSITCEKCKGKQSAQKWHYFLRMYYLSCWCYRKGAMYFPFACFPSQPFFFSQISQFSLSPLFWMLHRREKYLESCDYVNL